MPYVPEALTFFSAAVTAGLLGWLSAGSTRRRYWWRWRRSTWAIASLTLLAVHAVVGVVGVLIADALDWNPTSSPVLAGIVIGLAAHGLVRAELPPLFGAGAQGSPLSILRAVNEQVLQGHDDGCADVVERRLQQLSADEIGALAFGILEREIYRDETVPNAVRREHSDTVRKAAKLLTSAKTEGLGRLRGWCEAEIRHRHLTRPSD